MRDSLRTLPGRLTAAIVATATRHAWITVIACAFITIGALYYVVAHLGIDTDTSKMIDPNLPHRQAQRAFHAAFPNLTGGIVIFTEAEHAGEAEDVADLLATTLRARPDIARSVSQPGGGEFFATHGLLYLSTDELWALDERLQAAEPFLGTLAHDPSLRGLFTTLTRGLNDTPNAEQQKLLSRLFDRVSTAVEQLLASHPEPIHWRDELFETKAHPGIPQRSFVALEATLDRNEVQPVGRALDALREVVGKMAQSHPRTRIRLTGADVMDSEELVTVAEDAKLTTALSFGLVALVLVAGLRSPVLVLSVLITLAVGLVWTAAFATFCVGALNIISVCFAVLFIGMGVDFGIQYSMRYLEEADRGTERTTALTTAAREAGGALSLAAVGAAISFLAFVPTSYRGLAQLGLISGSSMVLAWLVNITLLPALLSRFKAPHARARWHTASNQSGTWIYRHHRLVLMITGVVVTGCLVVAPRARFDLNPLNLKDPHTPGVTAFRDLARDPANAPYTIETLADSLPAADALANKLAALPTVDKTVTLTSFVPSAQAEKLEILDGLKLALTGVLEPTTAPPPNADDEARAVREFRAALGTTLPGEQTAAWTASVRRLTQSLDRISAHPGWPGTTLPTLRSQLLGDLVPTLIKLRRLLEAEEITQATLPAEITKQFLAPNGQARIQVFPKADLNDNDAMREFVRTVRAVTPSATDAPVELYEGSRAVIEACIWASIGALVLTIILHIVVLHGVLDALLVAAPLVLALLFTMTTSVIFNIPFNFANIIALPLLIGLNNAYGAYLVVRKHAADNVGALLSSSTPRAVLFSGLTAIASFGVLGVSKHPGMAGMGVLISISLSYAILCALVVLPALMAAIERRAPPHAQGKS